MYINKLKRQLSAPGDIPPPEGPHDHGAITVTVGSGGVPTELPAAQPWGPPPVGQPGAPPSQVAPPSSPQGPPGWSPPGQVIPGQPKTPDSGDKMAANQLPNGVDPAAYENMFGEPTAPLNLGSDKLPSALTSTSYSRTTKGDMAAGIIVILLVAGLAIWAIIHYRRRRMRRSDAKGIVSRGGTIDTEGIVPDVEGGGGQFRVKTEMQEVKEPEKPEPVYGSFQTHRNGRQKSHPIYSLRNPRPNLRRDGNNSRPGTPSPPMSPVLSPAKERYYYRDRCRRKVFGNIGSSSRT
ncbi:hypothetical protein TWF281_002592 [Arthrobotrys megalospora]